ncbi:hypothetical protein Ais01nite_11260 [Asanoa ishikariensis]|nr:hypothetical protein [Asanoa ishikariensis]GIF63091.1 hypothetical protein Ais01nite_11260 [Asanoa ishikariensis]
MDVTVVRSNVRSIVGLLGLGLLIAAVVRLAPDVDAAPPQEWQPPAGYAVAETVPVSADRMLRLWIGPAGWHVESLSAGRSESAMGAARGGDQFAVSEILGGFVGVVPTAGTHAVTIRAPGDAPVHVDVHDGMFLAPVFPADQQLLVTPLDANDKPLTAEVSVLIAGRG